MAAATPEAIASGCTLHDLLQAYRRARSDARRVILAAIRIHLEQLWRPYD